MLIQYCSHWLQVATTGQKNRKWPEAPLDIVRVTSGNMKKLEAVTILSCTGSGRKESKKEMKKGIFWMNNFIYLDNVVLKMYLRRAKLLFRNEMS